MISINHDTINRQAGNLQNRGINYCWENYKFRPIKISGNRNQCLQYCLNDFYHDIDSLKKNILWSVVHWGQYEINLRLALTLRLVFISLLTISLFLYFFCLFF